MIPRIFLVLAVALVTLAPSLSHAQCAEVRSLDMRFNADLNVDLDLQASAHMELEGGYIQDLMIRRTIIGLCSGDSEASEKVVHVLPNVCKIGLGGEIDGIDPLLALRFAILLDAAQLPGRLAFELDGAFGAEMSADLQFQLQLLLMAIDASLSGLTVDGLLVGLGGVAGLDGSLNLGADLPAYQFDAKIDAKLRADLMAKLKLKGMNPKLPGVPGLEASLPDLPGLDADLQARLAASLRMIARLRVEIQALIDQAIELKLPRAEAAAWVAARVEPLALEAFLQLSLQANTGLELAGAQLGKLALDPKLALELKNQLKLSLELQGELKAKLGAGFDAKIDADYDPRFDLNLDGKIDAEFDADLDGKLDAKFRGNADVALAIKLDPRLDVDGDGKFDAKFDADLDGKLDARFDANFDGLLDGRFHASLDADLDGKFDVDLKAPKAKLEFAYRAAAFAAFELKAILDANAKLNLGGLKLDPQLKLELEQQLKLALQLQADLKKKLGADFKGKLDLGFDPRLDLDLDGKLDAQFDADLDGKLDAQFDADLDGKLDAGFELGWGSEFDLDLDGKIDAKFDVDGDGALDVNFAIKFDPRLDVDADGKLDAKFDADLDGKLDAKFDANLDGILDARFNPKLDANLDGKFDVDLKAPKADLILAYRAAILAGLELKANLDADLNADLGAGGLALGDITIDPQLALQLRKELQLALDLRAKIKGKLGAKFDGKLDLGFDPRLDLDLDGKLDAQFDADLDGKLDAKFDADADGQLDAKFDLSLGGQFDADLDGKLDAKFDVNGDGILDVKFAIKFDPRLDVDADGKFDAQFDADLDGKLDAKFDANLDGILDARFHPSLDANLDGKFDVDLKVPEADLLVAYRAMVLVSLELQARLRGLVAPDFNLSPIQIAGAKKLAIALVGLHFDAHVDLDAKAELSGAALALANVDVALDLMWGAYALSLDAELWGPDLEPIRVSALLALKAALTADLKLAEEVVFKFLLDMWLKGHAELKEFEAMIQLLFRLALAGNLEEIKIVARNAAINLGPWAANLVAGFNIGALALPQAAIDFEDYKRYQLAGDVTLGYMGKCFGVIARGYAGGWSRFEGLRYYGTDRFGGSVEAWWMTRPSEYRFELRGAYAGAWERTRSEYTEDVVMGGGGDPGDGLANFFQELRFFNRVMLYTGVRAELNPTLGFYFAVGGGGQHEIYDSYRVNDPAIDAQDRHIRAPQITMALENRLRAHWIFWPNMFALRMMSGTEWAGYSVESTTSDIIAGQTDTFREKGWRLNTLNRGFFDLEFANFFGFVPGLAAGADTQVFSEADKITVIVNPLVQFGIRSVAY